MTFTLSMLNEHVIVFSQCQQKAISDFGLKNDMSLTILEKQIR